MPDYCVKAAATEHGMPGLAWCLEERSRLGVFHPETAMELGLRPGPDFGKLQRGEAVTTAGGRVVQPGEVMDEAREGRKIVITGDTRPTQTVIELARGASVLVHDSTFAETERDRALETGHSTAKEAAEVAREAGAAALILTHLSSRHHWRELRDEARQVFPGALLPRDLDILVVPYPEKGTARFERV
jgi:ribonuclease Z